MRMQPVSFTSLALTALTGVTLLLCFRMWQREKVKEAMLKLETVGSASLGGPFTLLDQDGNTFTDQDLKGQFALLYFGFTYCPDICPEELEKIADAMHLLGDAGLKLQPVFISLDPERDNVKQVKSYVQEFYPRLIGLTGTREQVDVAARQYRVYHSRTDDSEDYLVDHSIIMYLIDPEGQFITFYGKNFTAEQLSKSLREHLDKHKTTSGGTK